MNRKAYNNGDPISAGNCNGCQMVSINGVPCHELGCPDKWRDYKRECKECGGSFWPEDAWQECCCDECHDAYHGIYWEGAMPE